ncbi:hypothetical protein A8H39_00100 [Paraburkholderia fungorum]|uniref:hypothetical protein n=1 Tax=Paraburkholderia fungorum TaxID=134537 RepID=UPI000485AF1D|nr:hypothetical protein [Paraburkholderia fungorum]PNE59587.1 hypothetical protein A8H39_00100 [Paraburkholderia fungorum]
MPEQLLDAMDVSTRSITSCEHGSAAPVQATNICWLSLNAWHACLWVGMFLFVFLEVERHLATAKVQRVVAARHAIRAVLRNKDAVSNLEHLLFGFCCAFAGFLMAQTLHHLDPAFATDGVNRREKQQARRRLLQNVPWLGCAVRMAGTAVRRFTPSPARVRGLWQKTRALRFTVRFGCTVAVVCGLNYFRVAAYSPIDIIPAMWLFSAAMWIVWGWRHLLRATATQPEFVMLVFGFGIWFEFDFAWKVVQLAEHKNTFPHAARHLTYSFGAFAASLAWFRLGAMRPHGQHVAASSKKPGTVLSQ